MDILKYIESACSKDKTRFNITGVYRAKNHLIGTDGHILLYSNGLPDMEPHYINGMDAQFPDWRQVLPEERETTFELKSNTYRELLLPFLKACKTLDNGKSIKIENIGNCVQFTLNSSFFTLKTEFRVDNESFPTYLIDPELLLKALKPFEPKSYLGIACFKFDPIRKEAPLVIDLIGPIKASAVIMPMNK